MNGERGGTSSDDHITLLFLGDTTASPAGAVLWTAVPDQAPEGWAPLGGAATHLLVSRGAAQPVGDGGILGRWAGVTVAAGPLTGRGGALLTVGMEPRPGAEEEFDAWYDTEHLPPRLAVPGVLAAARFRAAVGEPRYLAAYELEDASVFGGPEWAAAATVTPWTVRMRAHTRMRSRRLWRRVTLSSPGSLPFGPR